MNIDLLARLDQAQTDDERTWLITESLMQTLSPELRSAVWAAAVPHWFDADILAALLPNLSDQAASLYEQLQQLSFVEVFPGRGHNIHERTRYVLLNQFWQTNQSEYIDLSAKAAQHFANQSETYANLESLYHRAVAEPSDAGDTIWNQSSDLNNSFQYVELDALASLLLEHATNNRLSPSAEAVTYYRKGGAAKRIYENEEALANYEQAIGLFRDVGDRLGEANTLKATGDVLKFLDRRDEALANYEQAIGLYRDVGSRLGEANTLLGLGDLKDNDQEALDLYNQAQQLYQLIGDQNGQARNLGWFIAKAQANLGQVDEAIAALQAAADFYDRIGVDIYRDSALQRIEDLRS